MNALGKTPSTENGRISTNDRVVILDAGAQYGKAKQIIRLIFDF